MSSAIEDTLNDLYLKLGAETSYQSIDQCLNELGQCGLNAVDIIIHVERWRARAEALENKDQLFEENCLEALDILQHALPDIKPYSSEEL
jgi:aryl carrier-like protein